MKKRIAGDATLTVSAKQLSGDAKFTIRSKQNRWLTAPTAIGALGALFVIAYVESLLRALRRGARRRSAELGLAVVGAIGGAVVVLDTWVVGRAEPTTASLIAAAALTAVAGVVSGLAARRYGRRARLRPRGADTRRR